VAHRGASGEELEVDHGIISLTGSAGIEKCAAFLPDADRISR